MNGLETVVEIVFCKNIVILSNMYQESVLLAIRYKEHFYIELGMDKNLRMLYCK